MNVLLLTSKTAIATASNLPWHREIYLGEIVGLQFHCVQSIVSVLSSSLVLGFQFLC